LGLTVVTAARYANAVVHTTTGVSSPGHVPTTAAKIVGTTAKIAILAFR
jgi:hypothetical protein